MIASTLGKEAFSYLQPLEDFASGTPQGPLQKGKRDKDRLSSPTRFFGYAFQTKVLVDTVWGHDISLLCGITKFVPEDF